MLTFFAQPYDLDAKGFYFSTFKEYEEKVKTCINSFGGPVEEFEIMPTDGEDTKIELVKAAKIDQTNLEDVLDFVENASKDDMVCTFFLMSEHGLSFYDALDRKDECIIVEMDIKDAAIEFFDEVYLSEIPQNLRSYIDYDAFVHDFVHDLEISGDFTEFDYAGSTFTCTNANAL